MSAPDLTMYRIVHRAIRGGTAALAEGAVTIEAADAERRTAYARYWAGVAVLRYGGKHTGPKVAQKFSELLALVREAGLSYRGSPEFAGYDPPTTLPFLRRNEVWLELEPH